MNEVNLASVYEQNLEVAHKALEIIHSLELPVEKNAQKAFDCMVAGQDAIKEDEKKEDAESNSLLNDKKVFLAAYTRDVADTLMATLFRLNKLADQEELVKAYYGLTTKEQIDQWAIELKQQHDAKQEVIKKQADEQNAADEEMREFQDILMGRAPKEAQDGGSANA